MNDIIQRLTQELEARKSADPQTSYVAKLYSKGMNGILKKVGEEAAETIIAAKEISSMKLLIYGFILW
jgi:phosphoribosyl-ATP pyrophosphohydrolase